MIERIVAYGALAAGLILAAPAARADAIFTDSTFSDYTLGFAASSGNATFTSAECTVCGDPGAALRLTITNSDGSSFGGAVINPLFTYNPQTQGSIASISASVDKNLTVVAPPEYSFGNTFRPVIEQDGEFYTAVLFGASASVPPAGSTATTGYTNFSLTNLQATDFNQFDRTTGLVGTAHPNFSGDMITFGFGQVLAANSLAHMTGAVQTVISDFDNLSITVTTDVPEPSGLVLMVTGLGLVGLVGKGSRRMRTLG